MKEYITFNVSMFVLLTIGCYVSLEERETKEEVKDDVVKLFDSYQKGLQKEHETKLNDLPQ